jgi:hypothetical protein
MKKKIKLEKKIMEQFYSKQCVAESIKHVVSKESGTDIKLTKLDKFSCNLATILTRDNEVVAVYLKLLSNKCKIYIAKNGIWTNEDVEYIRKILEHLKNISKDAPIPPIDALGRDDVIALLCEVKKYCYTKLKSRYIKLKKDISIDHEHCEYVKSFMEILKNASIDISNVSDMEDLYIISAKCGKYYEKVKHEPYIPKKFLKHLKKVGSYTSFLKDIIKCVCNEKYKVLFSNIDLCRLDPIGSDQRISSWKSIIQGFIGSNDNDYRKFRENCLKDYIMVGKEKRFLIEERLRHIYGGMNAQLESEKQQNVYLHAEMNILTKIINQKDKKTRVFIAVSKKCCYLCELYIKFAKNRGYKIVISGTHKKIYHGWKLPITEDNAFKKALVHLLSNLDQIIRDKIKQINANENNENTDDSDFDDFDKEFARLLSKSPLLNYQ